MAELADALDLGSSVPDVRVQVSLSAPRSKKVNLAGIAQLVEHNLAKVRVASSSLVSRSRITFIYGDIAQFGRATHLHCVGQRFDPAYLHHLSSLSKLSFYT